MSTITYLKASNVKRLSAVEITPEGEMVIVGGDNGNGKSSVLDSIAMALGGKKLIPPMPLRIGETEASVEVTIDGTQGPLTIRRTFKGPGDGTVSSPSTLEVFEKRNGRVARLSSPQAVLDAMIGSIAFDPLEFSRLKPAAQAEKLRELMGLDTSELDAEIERLFKERQDLNRELKIAQARADEAETFPDAPSELVSVADLMSALRTAEEHNAQKNELLRAVTEAEKLEASAVSSVESKKREVAALERQLADARAELDDLHDAASYRKRAFDAARAAAAMFEEKETVHLREQITGAEKINAQVRANAEYQRLSEEANALKAKSDALTEKIESLREQKTNLLTSAKWPVPGMSFGDGGIMLNGLPFEQASSAESLRVSVAMGFAANPELKVLFIRDGSLLDTNSMRAVAEMAKESGGQLWVERVGDSDPCAIIIEDGHLRTEPELAIAG